MQHYTGLYAENEVDIPPKSQFVQLENGYFVYSQEKISGYFLEDLFTKLAYKLDIKREPLFVLTEDDEYFYIIYINDHRMRETIKYEKSEMDEESLSLIIDSFKEEFNHFLKSKIDNDKVSYTLDDSISGEITLDELGVKPLTSTLDMINKKIFTHVKKGLKQWSLPVLILGSLTGGLVYGYMEADKRLEKYFKENIVKYKSENKKLKADISKKKKAIEEKLRKIREFNSKKDILDQNPRDLYEYLNSIL